jgi:hypothetical protein
MAGAKAMQRILWTGLLATWLAACASPMSAGETRPTRSAAGTVTQPATGRAPPTRIPDVDTAAPAPVGEPVSIATVPRQVRRAVVADAAKRFQVAESAVVLARAEQVTWPDGSLGCHEPGRMYTQALVPGYRLLAKTQQGDLAYHTDSHGNLATCLKVPLGSPEALKKTRAVQPVTGPPAAKPDR